MRKLIFENVRCFRSRREVSLAPLTLLVGENSSGKSTFLALARLAWDVAFRHETLDFNEPPFQMGAFDAIAHYHGGQGKRATSFLIGCELEFGRRRTARIEAGFVPSAGQPRMSEWRFASDTSHVTLLRPAGEAATIKVRGAGSARSKTVRIELDADEPLPLSSLAAGLRFKGRHRLDALKIEREPDARLLAGADLLALFRRSQSTPRPYAVAPIRSKPRRTYDPIRDHPSPEGGHVPIVLSRIHAKSDVRWGDLAAALEEFGKGAGLFDAVSVRPLGRKTESDPFQIELTIRGQKGKRNILDVGYGVSQVLPILVDALTRERGFFLLQQPEVHLHPRAQAELGSFLSRLVAIRQSRFLVETHSDHLVDRVATAVKESVIKPTEVSLLFFESSGADTVVHPIGLDRAGNLLDAPESYRRFFLEEEARYLGL